MKTRTGNFPIGFRRGRGWQDQTTDLVSWALDTGFEALDQVVPLTSDGFAVFKAAGLSIGTADLLDWPDLYDPNKQVRDECVQKNLAYMEALLDWGINRFFLCVMPTQTPVNPQDLFEWAVSSLTPLGELAASREGKIVVEGWPGGGPYYANLACNPETYRRLIAATGNGVGVNYDPSHLIRMGIDPLRFLDEFLPHIGHVHAKDTEILAEKVYEYGLYQPSVFDPPRGFGEHVWRYTIPGHGQMRWQEAFCRLAAANWHGVISVELEDENFNGSEIGEKQGLTCSLQFLASV